MSGAVPHTLYSPCFGHFAPDIKVCTILFSMLKSMDMCSTKVCQLSSGLPRAVAEQHPDTIVQQLAVRGVMV